MISRLGSVCVIEVCANVFLRTPLAFPTVEARIAPSDAFANSKSRVAGRAW
jgi:hypothetical protein